MSGGADGAGRATPRRSDERRPGGALRIGLVGPIGCGKSTVARWLAEGGAAVVDADALARAVVGPGTPGFDAVRDAFGPGVVGVDGEIDRRALGATVFADPAALRRLEAILHPAVRPRILEAMARAEADGASVVVLEAIRAVDAGYGDELDEIWFVTCDAEEQRARLAERAMAPDAVEARMSAQEGLLARARGAATRVIDASGDRDGTRRRVEAALRAALDARRGSDPRDLSSRA